MKKIIIWSPIVPMFISENKRKSIIGNKNLLWDAYQFTFMCILFAYVMQWSILNLG